MAAIRPGALLDDVHRDANGDNNRDNDHDRQNRRDDQLPWPLPDQVDEAVRLYEDGWSLARIGERMGVDPKTVRGIHVVAVQVFPSPSRPHYLVREGLDGGVYVRVGSTNRRADAELIRET